MPNQTRKSVTQPSKQRGHTRKTFRVGISEITSGYVHIIARSAAKAEAIAQKILDEYGTEGFDDFDSTYRECSVLDCEEIES